MANGQGWNQITLIGILKLSPTGYPRGCTPAHALAAAAPVLGTLRVWPIGIAKLSKDISVHLLDSPRLVAQILGLDRPTARGGRDSIDHGPGGHDDLVNAAARVLILAVRGIRYRLGAVAWRCAVGQRRDAPAAS
jgi:hypothetical protein